MGQQVGMESLTKPMRLQHAQDRRALVAALVMHIHPSRLTARGRAAEALFGLLGLAAAAE